MSQQERIKRIRELQAIGGQLSIDEREEMVTLTEQMVADPEPVIAPKPSEAAMRTARRIGDRLETACRKQGINLSFYSETITDFAALIDADKTELVEACEFSLKLVKNGIFNVQAHHALGGVEEDSKELIELRAWRDKLEAALANAQRADNQGE